MRNASTIAAALMLALALAAPVGAQGDPPPAPPRDPAIEQEIYDRLAKIDPAAVPLFQEATRAIDADDAAAARRGYEQVLALAPNFPDALRRLSYAELVLGDTAAGVRDARAAYAAQDSPYNRAALAQALLATKEPANRAEALAQAQAAALALPDDEMVNITLIEAGAASDDMAVVRRASATLLRVAPDQPAGHFFTGLVVAEDGQWEQAEQELLTARRLGMSAEYVQRALDGGIASQARIRRWSRWGAFAFVAWLAAPVLLFLLGVLLSRLTLAAVRRPQSVAQLKPGTTERIIRALYKIVIGITSFYFYISLPMLVLVVGAGAAGIFYLFLLIGRIPIQLMFVIGLAALYTAYAVVRSVFTRRRDAEPGRVLPRDEAPALWALAEQVAERVGTRPIDAIYITPGVEVAVTERGSLLKKMRGAGQRCLILGLGALAGMPQNQLRAILAHEYGHFSNRDTAGGALALHMRQAMHQMAYDLAIRGQAHRYNPAWLFLNGFHHIYLRITLGASRLQEILADRYAALAYGVQSFVDGLTHIIRQSLAFDMQVSREVELAMGLRRGLQNLYTLPDLPTDLLRTELDQRLAEILSRPTSPYDSHPAVQERIDLLRQLPAAGDAAGQTEPALALLPNLETLQSEMTAIVQANVRRHQPQPS